MLESVVLGRRPFLSSVGFRRSKHISLCQTYHHSRLLLCPLDIPVSEEVKILREEIARKDKQIKCLKDALHHPSSTIEKPRPSLSASKLFRNPIDYDEFSATVDLVAAFIPNERLRAIRNWQPDPREVDTLTDFLRTEYYFALSLVHSVGGRETELVDQNLQHVVTKVASFFDANHQNWVAVSKKPQLQAYMAKAVHGEHSIVDTSTNIILIGCEAKGISASHRQCITQLLALCGNSAMGLRKYGIALEDCVALGIAFTDTGIQFCAVFLMDSSFPMYVNLSSVLHPLHDAEDIAKWMLRFVHGATRTLDDLRAAHKPQEHLQLRLNTAAHFFKPVREGFKGATFDNEPYKSRSILPSRLDHIFRVYDRLHNHYARLAVRPSDWSILFPVGCITVPSQPSSFALGLTTAIRRQASFHSLNLVLRPCLLFRRLRMAKTPSDALKLWRDFKPPEHLVEPYLASLRRAVSFLNDAGVAHFDLRPNNVLWRSPRDGCVEVMLVDFDDALLFNQSIPPAFASDMREDVRFPLYHMDKVNHSHANAEHNKFYVTQQEQWLACVDSSTFDEFMHGKADSITWNY